jgi:hypothetical protein
MKHIQIFLGKSLPLFIVLSLLTLSASSQDEEAVQIVTTGNVSFSLEKIKPIGNELHLHFTLTSLQGDIKFGLGNGLGGKIATITDDEGNNYQCGRMVLGKKRNTPYLDRITIKADSSRSLLLISADDDVTKLTQIKSLVIPTEKHGVAKFENINVPLNMESYPWEENTAEFGDRLYIKLNDTVFGKDRYDNDILKVPFQIINKSDTTIKFVASGSSLSIFDKDSTEHKSYYIVHNDEMDHYTAHYYFEKDSLFHGHFIFNKPEKINEINYMEFNPYSNKNRFIFEDL